MQGEEMCLLTTEMKLKLIFCRCVKKLVENHNEGMNITSIAKLINTEELPSFLLERMDQALRTVAHKLLTHKSITMTGHEEAIEEMEGKADTTGLKSLLMAVEKTGLNCTEVISFIELSDILIKTDENDLATVALSDSQSVHRVSTNMSFDALTELDKFQPKRLLEKIQLQPGDVIKTEVKSTYIHDVILLHMLDTYSYIQKLNAI